MVLDALKVLLSKLLFILPMIINRQALKLQRVVEARLVILEVDISEYPAKLPLLIQVGLDGYPAINWRSFDAKLFSKITQPL